MVCISELQGKKQLLSKKNISLCLWFGLDHVDKPEGDWKYVLWTDVKTLHSNIRTLFHLGNVVAVLWFGHALLPLDQDGLQSLMEL